MTNLAVKSAPDASAGPANIEIRTDLRTGVFFIHLPKTAGVALRFFLKNQFWPHEVCPAQTWAECLEIGLDNVSQYRLVQGHLPLSLRDGLGQGMSTVTFLREPVDRTISALKHLRRDRECNRLHDRVAGRSIWEILDDQTVMAAVCNNQVRLLGSARRLADCIAGCRADRGWDGVRALSDFEADADDGAALERAKSRIRDLDFVGLTEHFSESLSQMCLRFGLHPQMRTPLRNESAAADSDALLAPEEARNELRKRNYLDVELYEYARPLIEEQFRRSAVQTLIALPLQREIYPPIVDARKLALEGPMPGSGWFEAEWDQGAVYRWSGPQTESSIECALDPGGWYDFSIKISPYKAQDLNGFSIEVGGEPVTHSGVLLRDGKHGSYDVSFEYRKSVDDTNALTSIVFKIGRVYSPLEDGLDDVRKLGFILRSFECSKRDSITTSTPIDGVRAGTAS
ncbi:MAG TPA: sulfotransferase family 2 domain-containing protein [Caulobacteraceae bacterium]|nr:sulfotransferase family 2 domain-containing protein [Caulobacteraceae bacterium]